MRWNNHICACDSTHKLPSGYGVGLQVGVWFMSRFTSMPQVESSERGLLSVCCDIKCMKLQTGTFGVNRDHCKAGVWQELRLECLRANLVCQAKEVNFIFRLWGTTKLYWFKDSSRGKGADMHYRKITMGVMLGRTGWEPYNSLVSHEGLPIDHLLKWFLWGMHVSDLGSELL